jgi:hypothetical protein
MPIATNPVIAQISQCVPDVGRARPGGHKNPGHGYPFTPITGLESSDCLHKPGLHTAMARQLEGEPT